MTAVFKYIITEALFTNNAKLGSFVFNEDWMISTKGSPSGKTYYDFDPKGFMNYITSGTSYSGFIPNFAVDGKTGKTYLNDAYVKGTISADGSFIAKNANGAGVVMVNGGTTSTTTNETGVTVLDAAGIYSRTNQDGFRLNAGNGLQRYDSRNGWGPMFAGRRVDMLSYYSSSAAKSLTSTHDFVIADPSSGNFNIYLPISPANGKIITVQCVSQDRSVVVNAIGGSSIITAGDSGSYSSVSVNNYERAEFVAYGNNWYVTRSAWDYGD